MLSKIDILKDLDDPALEELKSKSKWRRIAPRQTLILHQTPARSVYFLCEGMMYATMNGPNGREAGIEKYYSGDVIADFAVLAGLDNEYDVVADTECLIAELPAEDFQSFAQSHAALCRNLLLKSISAYRAAILRIRELSLIKVRDRITAEIYRLALDEGSAAESTELTDEEAVHIDPAPSHERIAIFTGTTREAVSKQLSYLSKAGILKHRRGEIVVTDITALKRMVSANAGLVSATQD